MLIKKFETVLLNESINIIKFLNLGLLVELVLNRLEVLHGRSALEVHADVRQFQIRKLSKVLLLGQLLRGSQVLLTMNLDALRLKRKVTHLLRRCPINGLPLNNSGWPESALHRPKLECLTQLFLIKALVG